MRTISLDDFTADLAGADPATVEIDLGPNIAATEQGGGHDVALRGIASAEQGGGPDVVLRAITTVDGAVGLRNAMASVGREDVFAAIARQAGRTKMTVVELIGFANAAIAAEDIPDGDVEGAVRSLKMGVSAKTGRLFRQPVDPATLPPDIRGLFGGTH